MTELTNAVERMLQMAFNAGFEQARRYAVDNAGDPTDEMVWPGSGPAYTDWRAYGPGARLDGGPEYRANHEAAEAAYFSVDVRVCTVHNRFVPCRHGSPDSECYISARKEDIQRVQSYQAGWEMPLITRAEFDARVDALSPTSKEFLVDVGPKSPRDPETEIDVSKAERSEALRRLLEVIGSTAYEGSYTACGRCGQDRHCHFCAGD